MICKACSLTLSSSGRVRRSEGCGLASLFVVFALAAGRTDVRVLTTGSSTPKLAHVSFFWWCPTISFLSACRAADCSGHVVAFRSCGRIGEVWGRAMAMGVPSKQHRGTMGYGGEGRKSKVPGCRLGCVIVGLESSRIGLLYFGLSANHG